MDGFFMFTIVVLNFVFILSLVACVKLAIMMCEFWEKDDIDMSAYQELEEINSVSGEVCDRETL